MEKDYDEFKKDLIPWIKKQKKWKTFIIDTSDATSVKEISIIRVNLDREICLKVVDSHDEYHWSSFSMKELNNFFKTNKDCSTLIEKIAREESEFSFNSFGMYFEQRFTSYFGWKKFISSKTSIREDKIDSSNLFPEVSSSGEITLKKYNIKFFVDEFLKFSNDEKEDEENKLDPIEKRFRELEKRISKLEGDILGAGWERIL